MSNLPQDGVFLLVLCGLFLAIAVVRAVQIAREERR